MRWVGVALLSGLVLALELRTKAISQGLRALINAPASAGRDALLTVEGEDSPQATADLEAIAEGFRRLGEICTERDCSNPEKWI